MGHSFVIFGATQVGKSTLAGYLASRHLPAAEFDREMQIYRSQAAEMGIYENAFHKCAWISCFSSMSYDELTRPDNGKSTTKRHHSIQSVIPIDNNCSQSVSVVDTVGLSLETLEDFRGVFEADFGLILLTYSQLENILSYEDSESIEKLLIPLSFWCTFKPPQNVTIVISQVSILEKAITNDYHIVGNRINELKQYLKQKLKYDINDIPIIPISIETKNENGFYSRQGYNIDDTVSSDISERCLIDVIRDYILQSTSSISNTDFTSSPLIASPIRIFSCAKGEHKRIPSLRIKVIQGSLQKGSSVILGPVTYNNKTIAVKGIVASIKNDETHQLVSTLSQSWIGGIRFDSLFDAETNDTIEGGLLGIKLLSTSMLCYKQPNSSVNFYDCIKVKIDNIDDGNLELFSSMLPRENVRLYFMGKPLPLIVLEKTKINSRTYELTLCRCNIEADSPVFSSDTVIANRIDFPISIRDGIVCRRDKYRSTFFHCLLGDIKKITNGKNFSYIVEVPDLDCLTNDMFPRLPGIKCSYDKDRSFIRLEIQNINESNYENQLKILRDYFTDWCITDCTFYLSAND